MLFATGQTEYGAISPVDTHSSAGQLRLSTPSGPVAATVFSVGGDTNTELTNSGILTSGSEPFVLQPGTVYTLDFFVEVNGGCGGGTYFNLPTVSYIVMPAS